MGFPGLRLPIQLLAQSLTTFGGPQSLRPCSPQGTLAASHQEWDSAGILDPRRAPWAVPATLAALPTRASQADAPQTSLSFPESSLGRLSFSLSFFTPELKKFLEHIGMLDGQPFLRD